MSFSFGMKSLSLFVCIALVNGEGFLKHDPRSTRFLVGTKADFQEALSSVMGCAPPGEAQSVQEHLRVVEQQLAPLWRSLPRNSEGSVEWRSLRYVTHRYFLQQSHLLVRGLEPARQVNGSHAGDAEVLRSRVPSLVNTVLEGKRSGDGFSLSDAAVLVATMERLIYDSESTLLESAYKRHGQSPRQSLTRRQLTDVLQVYIVQWLLAGAEEAIRALLSDRSLLAKEIPHWESIKDLLHGMTEELLFTRQRAPRSGDGALLMERVFSFDDAHRIVARLTQTFAHYWESECQHIKKSLVAIDMAGNGRISLSNFYGANADGEWRFGESEEYLRELGALDEGSAWNGKTVIIPNYIQGASNCIVSSENYFICCKNECESILNTIEDGVGKSVATPEDILRPLNEYTDLDDEAPKLTSQLKNQLQRIAETHGGMVPLHGRLFQQWLHYLFPHECAFPHKVGTKAWKTPTEYGEDFLVSDDVVKNHATERNSDSTAWQTQALEEERLMSQWSDDEELMADYSLQLRAPWETSHIGLISLTALALVLVASGAAVSGGKPGLASKQFGTGFEQKAHFV